MEEKKKVITFPDEKVVASSELIRKLRADAEIPEVVMAKASLAFQRIQAEAGSYVAEKQEQREVTENEREASAVRRNLLEKSATADVTGVEKSRARKKKRSIFLAVAVAAAVCTASVGAAVCMKWSRSLAEGMLAEPEMQKSLEESKMTVPVNKSCTVNGITVTAEQSIVDSGYAYVAFKVEGFDAVYDVSVGEQPYFGSTRVLVDGVDALQSRVGFTYGADWYDGITVDARGRGMRISDGKRLSDLEEPFDGYKLEDGSYEYRVIIACPREEGYLIGKAVHIELKDLGIAGKGAFTPETEGTWSFDWMLEGSEDARSFNLDEEIGGTGVRVTHAEISPISLKVYYDSSGADEGKEKFDYTDCTSLVGVKLNDGTLLPQLYLGPGTEDKLSKNEYMAAYPIDRILDTSRVEALLFRKPTKDAEDMTEEEWAEFEAFLQTEPTENEFYVVPLK